MPTAPKMSMTFCCESKSWAINAIRRTKRGPENSKKKSYRGEKKDKHGELVRKPHRANLRNMSQKTNTMRWQNAPGHSRPPRKPLRTRALQAQHVRRTTCQCRKNSRGRPRSKNPLVLGRIAMMPLRKPTAPCRRTAVQASTLNLEDCLNHHQRPRSPVHPPTQQCPLRVLAPSRGSSALHHVDLLGRGVDLCLC
jgi:hypothetical protein